MDFLQRLLEALGAVDEDAAAALVEAAKQYPEGADRIAAVEGLLRAAAPDLDPAHWPATLAGIARDIATGKAGVDPDAWATGV